MGKIVEGHIEPITLSFTADAEVIPGKVEQAVEKISDGLNDAALQEGGQLWDWAMKTIQDWSTAAIDFIVSLWARL